MVCTHSNSLLHSNAFRYPEQPKIPFLLEYKSSFTYLVLNDNLKDFDQISLLPVKLMVKFVCERPRSLIVKVMARSRSYILHMERSRHFMTHYKPVHSFSVYLSTTSGILCFVFLPCNSVLFILRLILISFLVLGFTAQLP